MTENWSLFQAARVFFETIYTDFRGGRSAREKLLVIPPITQKSFEAAGRTVTWLEAATTKDLPPVIFLHGTPGSAHDWAWFLKNAADKYTLVAVDRPGFGSMDKDAPRLQNDREALAVVLAHYADGGQKPVVVGHSLGGGLAARLAADYPDKVGGLVLVGASLDPALERILAVQRLFATPPLSHLLTFSLRNSNIELLQYIDFLNDLRPRLPRITCPVTVLHSRDDRLVPYANVDYIRKNFTSAAPLNIMRLESGGHFLNKTRAGTVLDALSTPRSSP
jgi:pimeloyl-ACP methyl ester carboxylesterase